MRLLLLSLLFIFVFLHFSVVVWYLFVGFSLFFLGWIGFSSLVLVCIFVVVLYVAVLCSVWSLFGACWACWMCHYGQTSSLSLFWIPFWLCRVFVLVLCLFKASFNICRYFGFHCIPVCNRIKAINKWRDCYSKGLFVCKWPNLQFNRGSKDYFLDCNPILSSDNSSYMMATYLSFAQRLLRNSPRYKKEPKTSRKEPNKASWGSTSHLKSPKDSAANFLMSDTIACPKRGHVHAQWVSAIMEACARLTQQKAAAFNTVVISGLLFTVVPLLCVCVLMSSLFLISIDVKNHLCGCV